MEGAPRSSGEKNVKARSGDEEFAAGSVGGFAVAQTLADLLIKVGFDTSGVQKGCDGRPMKDLATLEGGAKGVGERRSSGGNIRPPD